MATRILTRCVLPCPVANDNKIEFQIAPPVHARRASTPHPRTASGIASTQLRLIHHRPLQSTACSLTRLNFLIANLELEFLASDTKCGLVPFSNRKKIAVFDPRRCGLLGESKAPSSPVTRLSLALTTTLAAEGSLITAFLIATFTNSRFRSTYWKHVSYRISNRNKHACFASSGSWVASHRSRTTNHESHTTSRAAFRSTIPRGQNADH